jgi:hypothetical protein
MPDDVIETNHWQRIEQDDDEGLHSDGLTANTRRSRHRIMDPPICDEEEWHRF